MSSCLINLSFRVISSTYRGPFACDLNFNSRIIHSGLLVLYAHNPHRPDSNLHDGFCEGAFECQRVL